ncbi:MAG: glycoside hydrolase family 65 protein [Alphaproteobacteria bacterium]|jgi:trehalose/maltose hydrolase-like predicted phosphorylase|nr:glycoside hydrolase family 65 protein [Alphaproteobacteria bacterium]
MAVADDLRDWVDDGLTQPEHPTWALHEEGYDPRREAGVEARFTVANGFLGVRGARSVSRGPVWVSWLHGLNWASWPRTYVAGLFDTPNTIPPVPALVPGPDWLRVQLAMDGQPVMLRTGELLHHRRTLDLERGLLVTRWHHRDPDGRTIRLRALRLVSLAERALGLQVIELTVDGRPCEITLEALLESAGSGLEPMRLEPDVALWRTALSGKTVAVAHDARVRRDHTEVAPASIEPLRRRWAWRLVPGEPAIFTRLVALARGEVETADATAARARAALDRRRTQPWRGVLEAHAAAWGARWEASDVRIDGDEAAERALRFAVYQLNSAADPDDDTVSIGARALTGDAYLGHVFWDTEIYLLPFYTLTWPEAARALLMYRFHTLDGARRKAARLGYEGALYAWESAETGDEATPEEIVDPAGRSLKILCGLEEQHISADVAYAVWKYWEATGDDGFMEEAGAEIVLETARFWASRAVREDDGRFHIRRVIGPDEYHETIDDNAYTNVMAAWNLARGVEVADWLATHRPRTRRRLERALGLGRAELAEWRAVDSGLVTGFDPASGLFEQFQGYFGLEDVPRADFAGRDAPADVVLGRARTQASQILKQADVVALLALLPERFEAAVHRANFAYYEPRCGHGSSLSRGLHAVVAARLGDVAMAHSYFHATAATDLSETLAASAGGIRIAAQGALWQAAVLGMGGLRIDAEGLAIRPNLPAAWERVVFHARWRGRRVAVEAHREPPRVNLRLVEGPPCTVRVGERRVELEAGVPRTVALG